MIKKIIVPLFIVIALTVSLPGSLWPEHSLFREVASRSTNLVGVARADTVTAYLPVSVRRFPFDDIFGVEMQNIMSNQYFIPLMQGGMHWIRRNAVLWDRVEAVEGVRDWSILASLEQELIRASLDNMPVVLIVRQAPVWAQLHPNSICGPIKPEKYASFAHFMHDLVARYSAPPYNVKYYEIGNEPDVHWHTLNPIDFPFGCWGDDLLPHFGGDRFADMLQLVYQQVKAASPTAQVLLGGLLLDCDPINPPPLLDEAGVLKDCSPSWFLKGIFEHGGAMDGGDYFDIVSFHAYDYYDNSKGLGFYSNANWNTSSQTTGTVVSAKVSFIRNLLSQYGYADKPIMNTESALVCLSDCTESFEATKAYYVTQVYVAATLQNLVANIWFDASGSWRYTGLLYADGTKRPAYFAYELAHDSLAGATYVKKVTLYPGVEGYEFRRGSRRLWVLWYVDIYTDYISGLLIDLPSIPVSIKDSLGNTLPPATEVLLTSNPLYIEWNIP